MEFRQMRSFLVLGETLHFRKTAEILHLSQPALSQQIQQLEEELGVPLLERSSRHVGLTKAGKAMLSKFRHVLKVVEDAQMDAKRVADGQQGPFHIAYVSTALVSGVLPQAIKAFRHRVPGVDLRMNGCAPPKQVFQLLNGEIDIGFMHGSAADFDTLESKVVQRDELIVAMPSELDTGEPVDLKKFAKYATITASLPASRNVSSFGIYRSVQLAYELAGAQPNQTIQATLINAVSLVANGVGIALVPSCFRQIEVAGVAFQPLLVPPPQLEFLAVWKPNAESALLRKFVETLGEL